MKKQFSTSHDFPAVFIDSFYDPKIIVEREKFDANSLNLLKYLQDITENYQLKDIDAVLTEMGRLKSNLSQLEKEVSKMNLTIALESEAKKKMRQLALEHNIKDDEMRFTLVDLIAAAAGGIGLAGSSLTDNSNLEQRQSFFNVGPPKESIFLTTVYGLYFSHQSYTLHYKLQLFYAGPLWAAFMSASTPIFLTCGFTKIKWSHLRDSF